MSAPGRPKGEFRRPQAGGIQVRAPGRPKGECRRPQAGGIAVRAPGRALMLIPQPMARRGPR
jgi:16S rRNA (guanine527-N7)-methyltransferase